jgi:hypothetical protein
MCFEFQKVAGVQCESLRRSTLPDVLQAGASCRGSRGGYPWTTLAEMKGDPQVIRKFEETEKLLKELKKALAR